MPIDFSSLGVRADLVSRLDELGIREPYPIQSATLPETLSGRDLFAQSPTGSGKTLAFAIPLVARVARAEHRRPRGLVLAPTRELAAQITEVILPLAAVAGRRVACFYGGTGYREQLAALRRGVDIAVGCPGRLIDLLERDALDLAAVEIVVVDEADRMADMGFLPPVRRLLRAIEGPRQTMLFSATLSRDVEQVVSEFQDDPARHLLESASDDLGTRSHEFWRVAKEERTAVTAQLVARHGSSIVFCRTKHGADRLARQLGHEGIAAVAIHGDRTQAQRDRALAQFRDRRAQVLVGTDVAARGLHVEGVDCVVHFDPPEDDDTYVHRSGRTGRAGASGRVVSLVTPDHERAARALERRFAAGRGRAPQQLAPATTARRRGGSGPSEQPGGHTARQPGGHTARQPGGPAPRQPGGPAPRQQVAPAA
ncbi:MAG TPA: DEAD/DEAH box helicase, partial [Acidimicrobiales bacterium]|nr:DEAD/DEAH box helicase [Acidimicrobiales bacterium]